MTVDEVDAALGTNLQRFARAGADADVAVIEGVMGLFDSSEGMSERGSTVHADGGFHAVGAVV